MRLDVEAGRADQRVARKVDLADFGTHRHAQHDRQDPRIVHGKYSNTLSPPSLDHAAKCILDDQRVPVVHVPGNLAVRVLNLADIPLIIQSAGRHGSTFDLELRECDVAVVMPDRRQGSAEVKLLRIVAEIFDDRGPTLNPLKALERRVGHTTDMFGSAVDSRERGWPVLAVRHTKLVAITTRSRTGARAEPSNSSLRNGQ